MWLLRREDGAQPDVPEATDPKVPPPTSGARAPGASPSDPPPAARGAVGGTVGAPQHAPPMCVPFPGRQALLRTPGENPGTLEAPPAPRPSPHSPSFHLRGRSLTVRTDKPSQSVRATNTLCPHSYVGSEEQIKQTKQKRGGQRGGGRLSQVGGCRLAGTQRPGTESEAEGQGPSRCDNCTVPGAWRGVGRAWRCAGGVGGDRHGGAGGTLRGFMTV